MKVPREGESGRTPPSAARSGYSIVLIAYTSMSNGEMRSTAADLRIRYTACWRERRTGRAQEVHRCGRHRGHSSGLTLAASTDSWVSGLHREVSCGCLLGSETI